MSPKLRYAAWVGMGYAGTIALVALVAAAVAGGLKEEDREALRHALIQGAPLLAFLAFLLLFLCAAITRWFFDRQVGAIQALVEQTRIVHSANLEHRLSPGPGPELAALAAEINRLGDAFRGRHADTEAQIGEALARLAEERNRLAALMSELSQGVLVCNREGRILLYNEQARALFAESDARSGAAGSPIGLRRSVFTFIDRDQVAHALERIQLEQDRDNASPTARFVVTAPDRRLIEVHLAPFLSTGMGIAGMVLTLEDVTRALGEEARRRSLLQELATGLRQPAANIRAAAENLVSFPEMSQAERVRFAEIVAAESRQLSVTLDAALREYADALTTGLSLEDVRLTDLLVAAHRRMLASPGLEVRMAPVDPAWWIKADSYAFVQALASITERLREEWGVREIEIRAEVRGDFAQIDLAWKGAVVDTDALGRWETQPVQLGAERMTFTVQQVLERHGGEIWRQADPATGTAWIRCLLPLAEPVRASPRRRFDAQSRPEYYDFGLFRNADGARELADQPLAELAYTAFDTETTGLEPSAGDRIVSIGAVRIVNGRLLKHEIYEQLVNPQRPVPETAARIHGLRTGDLADQPVLAQALPAFRRFCDDTVLVAHNGAFDMRFLELAEAESGVRFDQPVLDTLLLSAVVHRHLQDHRLEAIAERLNVPVVGRHTAVGDALVTGEIFLRLLPLLAGQGIVTLGQALSASRETYYVRLQY